MVTITDWIKFPYNNNKKRNPGQDVARINEITQLKKNKFKSLVIENDDGNVLRAAADVLTGKLRHLETRVSDELAVDPE